MHDAGAGCEVGREEVVVSSPWTWRAPGALERGRIRSPELAPAVVAADPAVDRTRAAQDPLDALELLALDVTELVQCRRRRVDVEDFSVLLTVDAKHEAQRPLAVSG